MKLKYGIDMVLVVGSLLVLTLLVGYTSPLVLSPLNDYESSESEVLFEIEKADLLIIDDNIDFTTPEEYVAEEGLRINLEPGQYYWKAVGIRDSEIRTLTINSKVVLELRESAEGYDVINAGNVRLNVDVYNGSELVDKIKIGTGEEIDSSGDKFVGGEDE